MQFTQTIKRVLSLVLCVALLGLCTAAMPSCDIPSFAEDVPMRHPFVFVHGLGGFGEDVASPISYWGSTAGDLMPELRDAGFECYAPSVSPSGSAWDRACELYAQMTGQTVDYGAAHSAAYGHARFGKTYTTPLFEGWGEKTAEGGLLKVNLIGHSFGGATTRLFAQLMRSGNIEEQNASPEDCSDFFKGGKGDWIFSVTSLAAPHNGVSLLAAVNASPALAAGASLLTETTIGSALLDQLEKAGISLGGMNLSDVVRAAQTEDTAFYDLSIHGAQKLNEGISTFANTYYFSFPVDGTKETVSGNYVATDDMSLPLRVLAALIAKYEGEESGIAIDDTWKPNDGLVNTISATAPFNDVRQSYPTEENPTLLRGRWYVMPTMRGDHGTPVGMGRKMDDTKAFYIEHMQLIDSLSFGTQSNQTIKTEE
ncbi:MAG: hypothetical protein LBB67_06515 [Oscillospiraceae bacterium]|jgi:triacylglycerol esterase/lipase EstA (alpha/beta hydrolase family)|nr:hypothetical protein [Oscillospiraceae bacterium]